MNKYKNEWFFSRLLIGFTKKRTVFLFKVINFKTPLILRKLAVCFKSLIDHIPRR